MAFTGADYVILVSAAAAGVIGLFLGFSGALAFLAGTAAGGLAGHLAWRLTADFITETWAQVLATLIVSLLMFGLVRWTVKKSVNGLLRQPADAVFGFLAFSLVGILFSGFAVWSVNFFELSKVDSVLVNGVVEFAGPAR